jgi:hypothetical protein
MTMVASAITAQTESARRDLAKHSAACNSTSPGSQLAKLPDEFLPSPDNLRDLVVLILINRSCHRKRC